MDEATSNARGGRLDRGESQRAMQYDPVSRPSHYIGGSLEAIDVIEDWGLGFHLGNAFKYIVRAGRKSKLPTQDLQKAIWYLERSRRGASILTLAYGARWTIGVAAIGREFALSDDLRRALLHVHAAAWFAAGSESALRVVEHELDYAAECVRDEIARITQPASPAGGDWP